MRGDFNSSQPGSRSFPWLRGGWLSLWIVAAVILMLATTPAVLAEHLNQTIPIPTATPTNSPVPTSTPTNTPPPATNTPVPQPTNTPRPGETQPAATSTPVATETPVATVVSGPTITSTVTLAPEFAMILEMSAPAMAQPGEQIEIRFTVTNPSNQVAQNVRVRDLMPAALVLISAEASNGGEALLETEGDGGTVVLFEWESLAAGASTQAVILAAVAPETVSGAVIDNLAVAYADNAAGNTAGISIGMPPALLPFFD